MYFFNARLRFKIPPTTTPIAGSVIAASAISPVDLQKRQFKSHPHLSRRILDPQIYMAEVDAALDSKTVGRLAAYPWFHGGSVPKYSSGQYTSRKAWKAQYSGDLLGKWTRTVPTDPTEIRAAARAAVEFQLSIGCEAIILPSPLTTIADLSLQPELNWLEAGLDACRALTVQCPVFATIALSEAVLHVKALSNPLLHALTSQVSAAQQLNGAYIVLEQSDPGSYFWTSKDPLMALLVIVDDLCRGAKKRAIVNYVGTFGLVASAVGAEIWSTGYFLMQRRFSLKGTMGIAHPRYHSLSLAGDIGLKEDLERVRQAGFAQKVMTATVADAPLRAAVDKGKTAADVPEWKYSPNNWPAAQRHYLEIATQTDAQLTAMSRPQRIDWVDAWLNNAAQLAVKVQKIAGIATDTHHQKVWNDVFQEWRHYAKE